VKTSFFGAPQVVCQKGSSLFCVDILIKTNGGLELKIILSIENDEELIK